MIASLEEQIAYEWSFMRRTIALHPYTSVALAFVLGVGTGFGWFSMLT